MFHGMNGFLIFVPKFLRTLVGASVRKGSNQHRRMEKRKVVLRRFIGIDGGAQSVSSVTCQIEHSLPAWTFIRPIQTTSPST